MARRSHPLSLILTPHGTAELLNSKDETLWASDADDDFREEFTDEFLSEDDIDDILDFLYENEIIDDDELESFEDEDFEIDVQCLDDFDHESNLDLTDEDLEDEESIH